MSASGRVVFTQDKLLGRVNRNIKQVVFDITTFNIWTDIRILSSEVPGNGVGGRSRGVDGHRLKITLNWVCRTIWFERCGEIHIAVNLAATTQRQIE